jgi:hypothetical protein
MSLTERLRSDISAALPWESARETTLPEFLVRYTLHDSQWLRVESSPDGPALALFEWDTFWTEGRVPHDSSRLADWPVLVLAFDALYQINVKWDPVHTLTVGDAESRAVGAEERERLFDRVGGTDDVLSAAALDDSLHLTTIRDVGVGYLELLHGATVRVLCIGGDGQVIDLPWGAREHSV